MFSCGCCNLPFWERGASHSKVSMFLGLTEKGAGDMDTTRS